MLMAVPCQFHKCAMADFMSTYGTECRVTAMAVQTPMEVPWKSRGSPIELSWQPWQSHGSAVTRP